ncbi:MAG: pyridoxamine 5'-phosphate oxidase family protein [Gammaproteobacteria bacterium]
MDSSKIRSTSAWSGDEIDLFLLESSIPARLACLTPSGAPLVCSLWYLYEDGAIWCATQKNAHIVSCFEQDLRCGFEVAPESPPYRGVRGQSRVSLHEELGADVLGRLIDRYLGTRESRFAQWLMRRQDDEVAIRVDPAWITAWDFTQRMGA